MLFAICKHSHAGQSAQRDTSRQGDLAGDAFRDYVTTQIEEHARSIALQTLPRPLQLNVDVEERPAWGLDCYTYR